MLLGDAVNRPSLADAVLGDATTRPGASATVLGDADSRSYLLLDGDATTSGVRMGQRDDGDDLVAGNARLQGPANGNQSSAAGLRVGPAGNYV